ncbi:hypothetical protein [uncultured Mediterranean phage]|nr:hypothetical protein [uncultured Mediterranean phage]
MQGDKKDIDNLKKHINWIKSLRIDKHEYTEIETVFLLDVLETLVRKITVIDKP